MTSTIPEGRHRAERRAPAEVRRDGAAERHTQHRAERAAGHEGGRQRRAQPRRKDAEDNRDADTAVSRFADADESARERASRRSWWKSRSRASRDSTWPPSATMLRTRPQRSASTDSGKVSTPTMSATTLLSDPRRVSERPHAGLEHRKDGIQTPAATCSRKAATRPSAQTPPRRTACTSPRAVETSPIVGSA